MSLRAESSTSRQNDVPGSGIRRRQISLFGHFGAANLGNEATFEAALYHFRRANPDACFMCICTRPKIVESTYHIRAIPSRDFVVKPWSVDNRLIRLARKVLVGIPSELYRWVQSLKTLWGTDALIVPGTGVLTDAYTLTYWGPYDLFRWASTAKMCRCKLVFLSVGAGPIHTRVGRFCVKAALRLANYRSYRDEASKQYLKGIGFPADKDPVYPDLAFSLPESVLPHKPKSKSGRRVVGLGLMEYAGRYGVEKPRTIYSAYFDTLVDFVKWLLAHDYDVRLLIGDLVDPPVVRDFQALLKQRGVAPEPGRIVDEPVASVEDLLAQLAATDFVVATRFHNVLLALMLNKPAIAISFHHKCSSLMAQMGLAEYCEDINDLRADRLIEQFCRLERNAAELKQMIAEKVKGQREALDEQYQRIFNIALPARGLERSQIRAGASIYTDGHKL